MDSKGNGHKAAGRPDGGQFDRRRGAGDDSDLGAECAYRTVSDYDQGRKLASDAIGRRRRRPVVLMSCSLRTGRPTVNPALIADKAGGGVDVVVLDGGGEDGFNSIAKPRGLGIWNGTVRAWRATGTSYWIKPGFDMVDSIAGWASWHAPAKAKPVDWHARAAGSSTVSSPVMTMASIRRRQGASGTPSGSRRTRIRTGSSPTCDATASTRCLIGIWIRRAAWTRFR